MLGRYKKRLCKDAQRQSYELFEGVLPCCHLDDRLCDKPHAEHQGLQDRSQRQRLCKQHTSLPCAACSLLLVLHFEKNKSKRLQKQSTTHQADEENSSYVTRKLTGRHDTIKMHGSLELTCLHCFPSFYPFKAKKIKNDAHSVPDS